jgi:acetyl-CoA synthetase
VDGLKAPLAKKIGAIASPYAILFAAELPKTRRGKIMKRLLAPSPTGGRWGHHDFG